ncbi:FkbM family methyltransferase, partial [bacterium]|nr:FkbM family methyltransferase [bacterium]
RYDGSTYTVLMNLYCVLTGSKARFSYDKENKEYNFSDVDNDIKLVFRHKKRALTYRRGLRIRIDQLASEYLLGLVPFADGDTVLDCGANIGELSLWFKFSMLNINYIGFEPSPLEFLSLKKNVAPDIVHNVGLWNEDGELDFYIASQTADSSLIEPPCYDEIVTIQTVRLETFVNEKIKFLKLEAEGAEPEILEGLGESLLRIEYICADLGFERGKDSESTLAPVTNFLLKRDFSLLEVSYPRVTAMFKNNRY